MLVRQKIISATLATAIGIIALTLAAYIFAADRVGRNQLVPELNSVYSELIQKHISTFTSDTASDHRKDSSQHLNTLASLINSMSQHFQIQEIAFYNIDHDRIIYACRSSCLNKLPEHISTKLKLPTGGSSYDITFPDNEKKARLVILSNISLPQFFILDTAITTLFVSFISILLLFMLYALVRRWQKQPYQNLVNTIRHINKHPHDKTRFDLTNEDTQSLSLVLNDMIILNELREESLIFEQRKSDKSRTRAICLSNETRQTNERLAQEITIRNSIEHQLNRTQNYLDSIIDSMPSALFSLDKNGFIIQYNQQASDWLKMDEKSLSGLKFSELFSNIKGIQSLLTKSQNFRTIIKEESIELILPNESMHADIVIYPLQDNEINGLVIRIDNVSQRHKMEEIIVQTEKMKSVGGLAAGMAHEINNPLGAILQGAQNIQRRLSADNPINQHCAEQHTLDLVAMNRYLEQRDIIKFLDNIQSAGKRASNIVNNMLQFSRGHKQQYIQTDISELIERTLNIARSDLTLTAIEISADYNEGLEDLDPIPCIPSEIEQVLLNLLHNSGQALKPFNASSGSDLDHSPQITITAHQEEQNIIIRVKDNGSGMEEDTRRQVFEPFFTTKEVGSGTGIGLFVCYFIITVHHQGQITVESELGQGACFSIKLPISPCYSALSYSATSDSAIS